MGLKPDEEGEWVDQDVRATVESLCQHGIGVDLAQRIYTTRLLGSGAKLGPAWRRQHLRQIVMNDILGERRCAVRSRAPAATWPRSNRRPARRTAQIACVN